MHVTYKNALTMMFTPSSISFDRVTSVIFIYASKKFARKLRAKLKQRAAKFHLVCIILNDLKSIEIKTNPENLAAL